MMTVLWSEWGTPCPPGPTWVCFLQVWRNMCHLGRPPGALGNVWWEGRRAGLLGVRPPPCATTLSEPRPLLFPVLQCLNCHGPVFVLFLRCSCDPQLITFHALGISGAQTKRPFYSTEMARSPASQLTAALPELPDIPHHV
jgi:hypothetical protein